jgi:hypothetical protein
MLSTYITVVLVIAFIAGIITILTIINNKHRKQKIQHQTMRFKEFVASYSGNIAKQEHFNNCIIACNNACTTLYFMRFDDATEDEGYSIPFKNIANCKVHEEKVYIVTDAPQKDWYTNVISLKIKTKNFMDASDINLIFFQYGKDTNADLPDLKKQAELWSNFIQCNL